MRSRGVGDRKISQKKKDEDVLCETDGGIKKDKWENPDGVGEGREG